jgi:hypothetical protein
MPLLTLLVGSGQLGGTPSLLLPLGFDISNSTVAMADAPSGSSKCRPATFALHVNSCRPTLSVGMPLLALLVGLGQLGGNQPPATFGLRHQQQHSGSG